MGTFTYLFINLCSIILPFIFSFEKKIAFRKKWYALFPAIIITGLFFIAWDHYMTNRGVWRFNNNYVTGIYWWNLPVEEWLFFITIPYSCVFVYEFLNHILKRDRLNKISKNISVILVVVLTVVVLFNTDKMYTSVKLSLAALMLLFNLLRNVGFMGKFYRSYLVCLIPFFIVNGLLTSIPVVTYNDSENLGIRLFTIPVEDTVYMLLLLLMNISIFEFIRTKNARTVTVKSNY